MTGRRWAGRAISAVLLLAVAALLVAQVAGRWPQSGPPAVRAAATARAVPPYPAPRGAAPRLKLGVTTLALARNWSVPWRPSELREVNVFEQHARRHADTVMWFADWAHTATFDARQARAVAARGAVPEISWEPWDASKGIDVAQPAYRLRTIIDGRHDAYIRRWARVIAAYGAPVRLRFAHEMNGDWYPWAEGANGNRRGEFVRAWRHVHAIFAAEGATNLTWIWSPVAGRVRAEQFPGADVVDAVGIAGFNGGSALFRKTWRSFESAFGPALDAVHALAPSKPVELSEIASAEAGGSKAAWIGGMFAALRARPWVTSLVWFNLRKETDWRIESSPQAQRAFAQGLSRASR